MLLSKKLGVPASSISKWLGGEKDVPAYRCPDIEAATGGLVRCEDLRPDVRWDVLRNTPTTHVNTAQTATENVAKVVSNG